MPQQTKDLFDSSGQTLWYHNGDEWSVVNPPVLLSAGVMWKAPVLVSSVRLCRGRPHMVPGAWAQFAIRHAAESVQV